MTSKEVWGPGWVRHGMQTRPVRTAKLSPSDLMKIVNPCGYWPWCGSVCSRLKGITDGSVKHRLWGKIEKGSIERFFKHDWGSEAC